MPHNWALIALAIASAKKTQFVMTSFFVANPVKRWCWFLLIHKNIVKNSALKPVSI
jgi:hypothetical protein